MQSFLAWKISENELFYPTIICGGYVVYLYFLWHEIFLLVYVFRGLWYETVCILTESNTEYSNVM